MADVDVVVRAQQVLDDLRVGRSADAVAVIEELVAEVKRLRKRATLMEEAPSADGDLITNAPTWLAELVGRCGQAEEALRSVLPDDPATANYQEETWCYWCHGEEDPERYNRDPIVLLHKDGCAWERARRVLGTEEGKAWLVSRPFYHEFPSMDPLPVTEPETS